MNQKESVLMIAVTMLLAVPALAGVIHVPSPIIELDRAAAEPIVTFSDSDASPSETYETDTAAQAGFVAIIGSVGDATWHTDDSSADDYIDVTKSVTGFSTLPAITSLTSITTNGSNLVINGVTRTFNSAADALDMATALIAGGALASTSSGVTLSEAGGEMTLTVDLEESWIAIQ